MASPTVAETSTSSENSQTTSHTVTLPSSISSGDLLILNFVAKNSSIATFPAGWTKFKVIDSSAEMHLAYRRADGGEGATITVTTNFTRTSAHICYRITGAADPATSEPEASTGASGSGTTPNADSLTASGGSKDYLWLALIGSDTNQNIFIDPPNYTNRLNSNAGTGTVSAGGVTRELTAETENPGNFQVTNSGTWIAVTIAIFPDEAATGTNLQINIGDVWKEVPAVQINIGDAWKEVAGIQINIGNVWKTIF